MSGVNKVIILGRCGNDPETKQFNNGGSLTKVSLATSEKWSDKNSGEQKEHTEWHNIIFNNRLAEVVQQYVRKGDMIYVEGSIRTRKWQDQNGQDRWTTEIKANQMQMLGGRTNANNASVANNSSPQRIDNPEEFKSKLKEFMTA